MPDAVNKTELQLEKVVLRLTIEAEFELDAYDNGQQVDECIEEALTSLQGYGSARISSRKLFGVPTQKSRTSLKCQNTE